MKYYTMYHSGSLEDAIKSCQKIEQTTFKKLIKSKLYIFYSYDERIKANRYILNRHDKNIGLPTWIIETTLQNILELVLQKK